MTRFFTQRLDQHDRSGFVSGNDRIDAYFARQVSQDVKRNYAACYVLVDKASMKLAGYYTLSAHTIPLTELPPEIARKLPRYPSVPAVLIGWMGRHQDLRGQSVGSLLLADAIARLVHSPAGAHGICADADADTLDEAAAAFYRAHQFEPFQSRPGSLFLPMRTALALFKPPGSPAP